MTKPSLLTIILQRMRDVQWPSEYWECPTVNFPELEATKYIKQRNGQSVWDHTMNVINLLYDDEDIALLAGLFHDLGKCDIQPVSDSSLPRFPGHPIASANIAEDTLASWGGSEHVTDRVSRIVSTHMYDISNAAREKTIRKFVADVGQDNIGNWFAVRIADSASYASSGKYYSRYIEPFYSAVLSYLRKQPGTEQPEFICPFGGMQIKGEDA